MREDDVQDDPSKFSFASMPTMRPVAAPTLRASSDRGIDDPTRAGSMPVEAVAPRLDARFGDDTFGERYRRTGTIGEGGMGEVRACVDARIGREVAMKLARPDPRGSQPDAQLRFLREACVQGQLEHPSVVPVYDVGRDPHGALYFTMKRVRGLTLEEIVQRLARGDVEARQRFSRRKLLTAFASVCLAVDFAHARGVLHRDLKPANVMLGDFGEVYVLDWGLAKLAAGEAREEQPAEATPSPITPGSSGEVGKTEQGAMMGTAGYMSPEQARGDVDGLDARSDVYALGAILFELLTLSPLHSGATVVELIASTVGGFVDARPSHRVPLAEVAPELEAILVRATRPEPDERQSSAREIAEAIDRYLDGDRDLGLRRDMAEQHAEAATRAADLALSNGSVDARKEALREVGRALALDPEHAGGKRTLIRVLTEAPRELPPSAAADTLVQAKQEQRSAARIGMIVYMSWLLYLPLILWMGLNNWCGFVSSGLFVLAALSCWRVARHPSGELPYDLVILGTLAISSSCVAFGPFVALPGMAATIAMTHLVNRQRGNRVFTVGLALGAFLVPIVLEWVGVLPPSYAIRDDQIVLLPRAFHFVRPLPTLVLLIVWNTQIIAIAALIMGRMRDLVSRAEERLHVHAWQMKQLLPDEAHAAAAMPQSLPSEPACRL